MGILILTIVLIVFSAGVIVGAAIVVFSSDSESHVVGQEDSYQPE